MLCNSCGKQLPDFANFCSCCGANLKPDSSATLLTENSDLSTGSLVGKLQVVEKTGIPFGLGVIGHFFKDPKAQWNGELLTIQDGEAEFSITVDSLPKMLVGLLDRGRLCLWGSDSNDEISAHELSVDVIRTTVHVRCEKEGIDFNSLLLPPGFGGKK